MTKFGKFGDYPTRSLESAEVALLRAWRSLERYQDDLVLVGGLAVHYLRHDCHSLGNGPIHSLRKSGYIGE